MTPMSRNTLAAAVAAMLALGATAATAQAQDTSAANQGQETGQVKDTSMANDTSGYNAYPSSQAADTMADSSARTGSAGRHTPKLPQQGGPVDTAGYTKFKETMGKAADTLSTPNGKTTNYRQHKEYADSSSASDSSGRSSDSSSSSSGAGSSSGSDSSSSQH
jgi:hypothetical protein